MNVNRARAQPWYREPWPWILMAGPATVVLASMVTLWLAVRSDDGLVADDYYKQGLAINKVLARSDTAERLGVAAELYVAEGRVRVLLDGAHSGAVSLRLVHPTRAGMDQKLALTMLRPGLYDVQMPVLPPGRWHVVLRQDDWRLAGDWRLPAAGTLRLGAHAQSTTDVNHALEGKR